MLRAAKKTFNYHKYTKLIISCTYTKTEFTVFNTLRKLKYKFSAVVSDIYPASALNAPETVSNSSEV